MTEQSCKNRKLGELDCGPLNKEEEAKKFANAMAQLEIIVIPSGTTQGYLLSTDFQQNKKMFRFGLPCQMKKGSYAWTEGFKKELTKCCSSKKAVMVNLSGGRLYRSPLHEVIDNKEFLKDVKKLLRVKDPDIYLDGSKRSFENAIFRGYLAIRNFGEPTVEIDVLELSTKDGEKTFGLDIDLQQFDDDTHLEEYTIGRFCVFQQRIADLFFSTKVL